MTRIHGMLLAIVLSIDAPVAIAQSPTAADGTSHSSQLSGKWIFDAASRLDASDIAPLWTSKLTVAGDAFRITKLMDLSKDFTGRFVLDPKTTPKSIDLKLDEFDFAAAGAEVAMKFTACTLAGIYKLDGDRLTISLALDPGQSRPSTFDAKGQKIARFQLVKAPTDFKEFPSEVVISVKAPDGKPIDGAIVTSYMGRDHVPSNPAEQGWHYQPSYKTGADGSARMKFEELRFGRILARDEKGKRMAIQSTTPYSLIKAPVELTLVPECQVSGEIVCDELKQAGEPMPWGNVYAIKDGRRFASCGVPSGKFAFTLPPGTYTLHAYGSEMNAKDVPVTVPDNQAELHLEPIALNATALRKLIGKPAPELAGVVGWKGDVTKLSDLKGRVVLLEFWGYWCNPCVASMPVLIELHEKFADKGLTIIGVHLDAGGDVDTPAKLDEKIQVYKNGIWKGKGLPFPVALVSGGGEEGSQSAVSAQYGVLSYPTTVMIDRDGKVVGRFHARDLQSASMQIEKMLGAKKGGE